MITARRVVLLVALAALGGGGAVQDADARTVSFRSPSGNIGCIGETTLRADTVRCDIRARRWSPPPRPRGCTLDWGLGMSLDRRGRARWVCAGDTALGRWRVLAYGATIRIGRIACRSRTTALTCANADGHGFALSRERARRF